MTTVLWMESPFERLGAELLMLVMEHLDLASCFALLASHRTLWRLCNDKKLQRRLAARPVPRFQRTTEFASAQSRVAHSAELLLRSKVGLWMCCNVC